MIIRYFGRGAGDYEALRRYVNPIADWKKYTKVMIDPVQLWMGQGSSLRNIPTEERLRLTSLLFGKIRDGLLADYRVVREPGPHVMRISVALTEARSSNTSVRYDLQCPSNRICRFRYKIARHRNGNVCWQR